MLHPNPASFRKDLELLAQQLQAVREEFRERNLLSDVHKAIMDRMQQDKERLKAKLAEVEGERASWDLLKTDFAGAWNSFVADLEMLKLRLMDAESARDRKPPIDFGFEAEGQSRQLEVRRKAYADRLSRS